MIMDYIKEGAYELPYILHKHITLHSYSESGYKEYPFAACDYVAIVATIVLLVAAFGIMFI